MHKKSWTKLLKANFKPVPLNERVVHALDVLWSASSVMPVPGVTTTHYFTEMRKVLEQAIWEDTKAAIAASGGPEMPDVIVGFLNLKTPTKVKLNLMSLNSAYNCHCKYPGHKGDDMFFTLARCAAQRISVIRHTLLSAPRDFWIGLLLTDILAEMSPLLPKKWEIANW